MAQAVDMTPLARTRNPPCNESSLRESPGHCKTRNGRRISRRRRSSEFSSGGSVTVKVSLRFNPSLQPDEVSHSPTNQITSLEMNPSVAAGDPRLIGGVGERLPFQRHLVLRRDSRLDG